MAMSKNPVPSSPAESWSRLQKMGSPSRRGQHDQTMRPRRSTRAAMMLLPMMARFRSCIGGSLSHAPAKRGGETNEPRPDRGRGREDPIGGVGVIASDGDPAAAEPAGRGKAVAVGGVVAEEDRPAAHEWRPLHEGD